MTGCVRVRLSRNAGADCRFVAPYTWQETPFDGRGACTMELLPNAFLGEGTYYEYQIVRHDVFAAKVIQKGIMVVPEEDCRMTDLITLEPSQPAARTDAEIAVAKAQSYAAEVHNAQAYVAWMKEGIAESEQRAAESAQNAGAHEDEAKGSAEGAAEQAGIAGEKAEEAQGYAVEAQAILDEMREYVTDATPEKHGLMSAEDKGKLDGVEAEANRYVHPAYDAAAEGLYLVAVDETGHVSAVRAVEKQDIVALGLPAQDTVYSLPAASAGTLGGVKVGSGLAVDADGTLNVERPAVRTAMDSPAVPGVLYCLGEQAGVDLTLPAEGEAGQEIGVIFYSGATPATLTVTGALPFNFAPAANSRVELNALHDGEAWQVLWAEQATEAASAASAEAGA